MNAALATKHTISGAGLMPERQLALALGDVLYAVSLGAIHEVIRFPGFPASPHSADGLQGAIRLRGRTIPVVDLRERGEAVSVEAAMRTCVVILQMDVPGASSVTVGLVVDGIREVFERDLDRIRPVAEVLSGRDLGDLLERGRPEGVLRELLDQVRRGAANGRGGSRPTNGPGSNP